MKINFFGMLEQLKVTTDTVATVDITCVTSDVSQDDFVLLSLEQKLVECLKTGRIHGEDYNLIGLNHSVAWMLKKVMDADISNINLQDHTVLTDEKFAQVNALLSQKTLQTLNSIEPEVVNLKNSNGHISFKIPIAFFSIPNDSYNAFAKTPLGNVDISISVNQNLERPNEWEFKLDNFEINVEINVENRVNVLLFFNKYHEKIPRHSVMDSGELYLWNLAKTVSPKHCEVLEKLGQFANDYLYESDKLITNLLDERCNTLLKMHDEIKKEVAKVTEQLLDLMIENNADSDAEKIKKRKISSAITDNQKVYVQKILKDCLDNNSQNIRDVHFSMTHLVSLLEKTDNKDVNDFIEMADVIENVANAYEPVVEKNEFLVNKEKYKQHLFLAASKALEPRITKADIEKQLDMLVKIDKVVDENIEKFVSSLESDEKKEVVSAVINNVNDNNESAKDAYKRNLREIACDTFQSSETDAKKIEKMTKKKIFNAHRDFSRAAFKDQKMSERGRKILNIIGTVVLSIVVIGLIGIAINYFTTGRVGLFGHTKSRHEYEKRKGVGKELTSVVAENIVASFNKSATN